MSSSCCRSVDENFCEIGAKIDPKSLPGPPLGHPNFCKNRSRGLSRVPLGAQGGPWRVSGVFRSVPGASLGTSWGSPGKPRRLSGVSRGRPGEASATLLGLSGVENAAQNRNFARKSLGVRAHGNFWRFFARFSEFSLDFRVLGRISRGALSERRSLDFWLERATPDPHETSPIAINPGGRAFWRKSTPSSEEASETHENQPENRLEEREHSERRRTVKITPKLFKN